MADYPTRDADGTVIIPAARDPQLEGAEPGGPNDYATSYPVNDGTGRAVVLAVEGGSELNQPPVEPPPVEPPVALEFGNTDYPARVTASNAPNSRKLAILGDSRAAGISPLQFGGMMAARVGEWAWYNGYEPGNEYFNKAVGSTSIFHAVNTQAPDALAENCRVFIILTGTNGARKAGEGDEVDTAATRETETRNLLNALDQPGAVIFLANEIPGQNGIGAGTPQIKVDHHNFINTLTTSNAGPGGAALVNATLVVVNTWDSLADTPTPSTATNILTGRTYDGLHPSTQGAELMVQAFWNAFDAHFGNDTHLDFTTPAQNLLDGTTIQTDARGTLPGTWRDFTLTADGLEYVTTGTGLNTTLVVGNTTGGILEMAVQCRNAATTTDAVVFVDYSFAGVANVDRTLNQKSFGAKYSLRNFDLGTGATIANYATPFPSANSQTQVREFGGRNRDTIYLGANLSGTPRVDLTFEIGPGQIVTFHRVGIYER